ncbi:MAG TPA: ATP-dependent DNA ligase [Methanofastidiosum sp.]|uniref:DNA ligase n=1 Tax=Candidatus Methanofastidiosum methylothiophilum TaxID=1705564 RepID=A0A150JMB6_9EURY|nr:MAG: DNA ligase [Candidatus Methanofastidiosum methylthiophilus]HNV94033.1 ATP-dependent DNA ligase [Methanofastidiosum sp.]HPU91166.1 ATP-dependent DNA ligase [Methanofastidiosum sp.]HPX24103.1 ATP-dependent DNA ligase [Methanofastidiosum sp.]
MLYRELVDIYEKLTSTSSKLEKRDILSDFLLVVPDEILPFITGLLAGYVFPKWTEKELGIGPKLLLKVVSKITGITEKKVEELVYSSGDFGEGIERAIEQKKQQTFFDANIEITYLMDLFEKVSSYSGKGSQDKKIKYLSKLFSAASPIEARYLSRIILEQMRTGAAEGIILDAISKFSDIPRKDVEKAYLLTNDLGLIALYSRRGIVELSKLNVTVGRPLKPMLAQIAGSIDLALKDIDEPEMEVKYDGARIQVHKSGEIIKIFSRRLENITDALPEIFSELKVTLLPEDIICEGEVVAYKDGKIAPFQYVLRRLRRKYQISELSEKIPLKLFLFDCLLIENKSLIDLPLKERRNILISSIKESKIVRIAENIVSKDPFEVKEFYDKSVNEGHEGIIIKDYLSQYQPGARGKKWLKIKRTLETLDLVIIGAEWGEGRRKKWLSSLLLGIRDEEGSFLPIGKVATGLSDELFNEITEQLTPLILEENGKTVTLVPKIVVEVLYDEMQHSPKYESGFALRFPRVLRIRDDKDAYDSDTISRAYEIYESQEKTF